MPRTVIANSPLSVLVKETDGCIWIPAHLFNVRSALTNWTSTRVAAGDYCIRKSAADETAFIVFDLTAGILSRIGTDPTTVNTADAMAAGAHDIRGIQIQSIDVVYQITGGAMDAHTFDIHTAGYANNAPALIASTFGGTLTGTLATAVQANPYVTRITLGTPGVPGLNVAQQNTNLEITSDAGAASVVSYYGLSINCHYNLL